jgi:hypothetical protein
MADKVVSLGSGLMNQVKERSLSLVIVALGFAAGGVWKDAIVKWLEPVMKEGGGAMELTITAIITTVVVVLVIVALTKLFKIEEKA